jgi:8-oxo-dGTP diphosphatase
MKKEDNKTHKEIVIGIIKNSQNKVLIINRLWQEKSMDGSTSLTWVFPGGNIDEGETNEEALAREIRNETGFKVSVGKMISERMHPQFPVKIHYYVCDLVPSSMRPIVDVHEVESTKWVPVEELKDYFTTDIDPGVSKYLGL